MVGRLSSWGVSVWNLSRAEFLGFVGSVGLNTGVLGINIAHELIHKSNATEQFLGKVLLVSVFYGHFFIEHIFGHHRHVSTPHVRPVLPDEPASCSHCVLCVWAAQDPATSRLNETFYGFWPRSVVGSWLSAWHIEVLCVLALSLAEVAHATSFASQASRLAKRGKALFGPSNQMLWFTLGSVSMAAGA